VRKLSTIDYPNKLCMSLTVAGCNYRCPYCPYKQLIYDYIPMEKTSLEDLVQMLRPRLGFLDGVSIDGGEPLLHRGLVDFLKELRYHGSKIKLKTNASRPSVVKVLLDKYLVDYFSVFIPAPLSIYKDVVNYRIDIDEIDSSIHMIRKSGLNHEFRVKPVPGLIGEDELLEIANYLAGAPRFVLERFEPDKSMDEEYRGVSAFSVPEFKALRDLVAPYFNETFLQI
jgi:pyruvate formate lyase activating enzyme